MNKTLNIKFLSKILSYILYCRFLPTTFQKFEPFGKLCYNVKVVLILLTPFSLNAQVFFVATSDAKQVALGDVFQVKFTLNNAQSDKFTPPSFTDFMVVGGPNRSNMTQGVNGVWQSSETISYVLQGKKEGQFTVGAATIVAGGKTYNSAPLTIEVTKGNRQTFGNLPDNSKEGVMIRAEISQPEAYVGQQVILDYKIYSRVDVNNMDIVKEPTFDGFFKRKLQSFPEIDSRVTIGGKQYLSRILGRVALFPQREGVLSIDPMGAHVSILRNDNRDPFFGSLMGENVVLQSNTAQVKVKPLPASAPTNFTGGIGSFQMETFMTKTNGSTDDVFSLKMKIVGNGDAKKWVAPKFATIEGLEIYEAKTLKEEETENQGEIQTVKEFEYLIMPKKAGQYTLKPEFVYYDTEGGQYKTLSNNEFNITVTQGNNKVATVSSDDFDMQSNTSLISRIGHIFETAWVRNIPILLLLGIGGFYGYKLYQNTRKKPDNQEVIAEILTIDNAQIIAQQHLAQADIFQNQNKGQSFYEEISKAMFTYASGKLNIPLSEFTKSNIEEKLTDLKISPTSIQNFIAIIKNCELALFGGQMGQNTEGVEQMRTIYQRAMQVIMDIEKEGK
jgi:hypothetical protein